MLPNFQCRYHQLMPRFECLLSHHLKLPTRKCRCCYMFSLWHFSVCRCLHFVQWKSQYKCIWSSKLLNTIELTSSHLLQVIYNCGMNQNLLWVWVYIVLHDISQHDLMTFHLMNVFFITMYGFTWWWQKWLNNVSVWIHILFVRLLIHCDSSI